MTLYARSDLMSVSVPVSSGGCGAGHSRPVTRGAPAKEWKLQCPPCESFLKGGGRTTLKYTPGDLKNGITPTQERVADCDPCWSTSPEAIPLTPDESRVSATRAERGAQQIQMIQALAALRSTGIEVPAEAMWLLERELPDSLVKGKILCAAGHENVAGAKFCAECGTSMSVRAAVEAPKIPEPREEPRQEPKQDTWTADQLEKLHGQTLKKMCRERGLPDTGGREEVIKRLSA